MGVGNRVGWCHVRQGNGRVLDEFVDQTSEGVLTLLSGVSFVSCL